MHRFARARQAQREQETLRHLPGQAHPQIGEVDLRLRPGRVALGHEPGHHPRPRGVPRRGLRGQLRPAAVHVLRDIGVRHRSVVLGAQPLVDPLGGVALLARRRPVRHQHRVDQLADRVEHRHRPLRAATRRRDRRVDRLAHRAPVHPVLVGQRPDRHPVALGIEPDRRVQLHPRPHPGPYARAEDEQRTTPTIRPNPRSTKQPGGVSPGDIPRVGPTPSATPAPRPAAGGARTEKNSGARSECYSQPIHPETVVIVENKESAYLVPDRPRTVIVHSLGNHLNVLDKIGWLPAADQLYWGDLDRAGFTLLSRARARLPA